MPRRRMGNVALAWTTPDTPSPRPPPHATSAPWGASQIPNVILVMPLNLHRLMMPVIAGDV